MPNPARGHKVEKHHPEGKNVPGTLSYTKRKTAEWYKISEKARSPENPKRARAKKKDMTVKEKSELRHLNLLSIHPRGEIVGMFRCFATVRYSTTTVCVLFCFCFCFFGDVAFSEYLCTIVITVLSLHGEYVVRFSLPGGVFLPCLVTTEGAGFLHISLLCEKSINQPNNQNCS